MRPSRGPARDKIHESKTYLHFASDGHFNTLGHQWLAKALTKGLEGSITRP